MGQIEYFHEIKQASFQDQVQANTGTSRRRFICRYLGDGDVLGDILKAHRELEDYRRHPEKTEQVVVDRNCDQRKNTNLWDLEVVYSDEPGKIIDPVQLPAEIDERESVVRELRHFDDDGEPLRSTTGEPLPQVVDVVRSSFVIQKYYRQRPEWFGKVQGGVNKSACTIDGERFNPGALRVRARLAKSGDVNGYSVRQATFTVEVDRTGFLTRFANESFFHVEKGFAVGPDGTLLGKEQTRLVRTVDDNGRPVERRVPVTKEGELFRDNGGGVIWSPPVDQLVVIERRVGVNEIVFQNYLPGVT